MNLFSERVNFRRSLSVNQKPLENPTIENLIFMEKEGGSTFSILSQFFVAPFIYLDKNGMHSIFFSDKLSYDTISKDIAYHFNTIQLINWGEYVEITLRSLKDESKKTFERMLNKGEISSFIIDFFKTEPAIITQPDNINTIAEKYKEFEVNLDLIDPIKDDEIGIIWEFISSTYINARGEYTFLPQNWIFNDNFKDLISIKAFASFCSSMYVTVDCRTNLILAVSMW